MVRLLFCNLFSYGDIAPRSVVSRCVVLVWFVIGVIVMSIINATVLDAVTGTESLNIYKKKVGKIA